ncbi:MAG: hypothetical protein MUE85_13630 [Microscillaceae bacterium]|nr:hypothetical protein [Microscillaceae bacterium]
MKAVRERPRLRAPIHRLGRCFPSLWIGARKRGSSFADSRKSRPNDY